MKPHERIRAVAWGSDLYGLKNQTNCIETRAALKHQTTALDTIFATLRYTKTTRADISLKGVSVRSSDLYGLKNQTNCIEARAVFGTPNNSSRYSFAPLHCTKTTRADQWFEIC